MANTLFLRLEGPLQAWGERARWGVRDSAPEPTKSGVVGLLACALGLQADADIQALSRQVRIGVRCDLPGEPLRDYHTVVGGVLSAEGKIKRTGSTGEIETVVSERYYLADASFLVAVQAPPELIERMAEAVQHPHWPIYLGRKSCVPTRPVFAGTGDYPTLLDALRAAPRCDRWPSCQETRVRVVVECAPREGVRRRDEIVSRAFRTYATRYTCDLELEFPPVDEEMDQEV
ncbi:MAG: type I-E CRISPR-associated protein Cas5/CasD [Ardenticatenia bacterium]|jgi:CRISPR system Cascade subunit CasD|nr:MAG: type I-E CRISPR-associated protein Cas5/CasD [Ardenticatenia bacterium]